MHVTDPVNRIMSEPILTIGPEESVSIERADRLDETMRHAVAPGLGVAS